MGFSGQPLLSIMERAVAELQTSPGASALSSLSSLPVPALPARVPGRMGTDRDGGGGGTQHARLQQPPGNAGLGKSERRGPSLG